MITPPLFQNRPSVDEKEIINQRDGKAVALCLFFYLVGMFAMSVFETLATTLAMDEFGWTPEEADKFIGYVRVQPCVWTNCYGLHGCDCVAVVCVR